MVLGLPWMGSPPQERWGSALLDLLDNQVIGVDTFIRDQRGELPNSPNYAFGPSVSGEHVVPFIRQGGEFRHYGDRAADMDADLVSLDQGLNLVPVLVEDARRRRRENRMADELLSEDMLYPGASVEVPDNPWVGEVAEVLAPEVIDLTGEMNYDIKDEKDSKDDSGAWDLVATPDRNAIFEALFGSGEVRYRINPNAPGLVPPGLPPPPSVVVGGGGVPVRGTGRRAYRRDDRERYLRGLSRARLFDELSRERHGKRRKRALGKRRSLGLGFRSVAVRSYRSWFPRRRFGLKRR